MFLILHGQTEWNRDGRLQGHSRLAAHRRTAPPPGAHAPAPILRAHLLRPARIIASPLEPHPGDGDEDHRAAPGQAEDAIETDARPRRTAGLGCRGKASTRATQISTGWPDRWKRPANSAQTAGSSDSPAAKTTRCDPRPRSWYAIIAGDRMTTYRRRQSRHRRPRTARHPSGSRSKHRLRAGSRARRAVSIFAPAQRRRNSRLL